ncbi:ATP-binding cassette domain-containing protein [Bacillus sp. C1-1]|nr:ATP-binding cassette domain-containing protein [Bacillus sp. C1-1]
MRLQYVQVKQLSVNERFIYRKRRILDNISFSIRHGEAIGLFVENRQEREWLMDLLLGMKKPNRGEIIIGQHTITNVNEEEAARIRREEVAFVSSRTLLMTEATVEANLQVNKWLNKKAYANKAHLKQLLIYFEAESLCRKYVKDLDSREKELVRLIRALWMSPYLILMEEPEDARTLKQLIQYTWSRQITFLFTTSQLKKAELAHGMLSIKGGVLEDHSRLERGRVQE